jgi:phosphoribulokinase
MPHRPVILGVAGDSASGKTTIAEGIAGILGLDHVTVICTDDYHRYSRRQRKQLGVTALHPDGNDLEVLERDMERLAVGEPILKPVYDHRSGEFDAPIEVVPRTFVLMEGLLAFATPSLRMHPHVKVYLDPPEGLRRRWKISRDTHQRGYTVEQVMADLRARESDAAEFIRPQRRWADLVVRFFPEEEASNTQLSARLIVRPGLPELALSDVIAQANEQQPVLHERVGRDDGRLTEFLDVDGRIDARAVGRIASALERSMPTRRPLQSDGAGLVFEGAEHARSWPLATVELLIAAHLLVARIHKERSPLARGAGQTTSG